MSAVGRQSVPSLPVTASTWRSHRQSARAVLVAIVNMSAKLSVSVWPFVLNKRVSKKATLSRK